MSFRPARLAPAPVTLVVATLVSACGSGRVRDEGPSPAAGEVCSFDDPHAASLTLTGDDADVHALTRSLAQGLPSALRPVLAERWESQGATHFDFAYELVPAGVSTGLRLCERHSHAHRLEDRVLVEDRLPPLAWNDAAWARPLPAFDAPESVLALAVDQVRGATASLLSSERCLLIADGAPVPAWAVRATIDGQPYLAVGTAAHLDSVAMQTFEVTGAARVYKENPQQGELVEVPLPDLEDGTRLKSSRFATALAPEIELADNADRRYLYEPSDPRFVEVSLFANAERMAAWFTRPEHGYAMNCLPITIKPHFRWGESTNNGEYRSPDVTRSGLPEIWMGDGDGVDLQNLGLDFDAVAHELGHHVVFRRVKKKTGESMVLHEAMSDFFVYAATGNACLGESTCPAGSALCSVEHRCLRPAEYRLRLDGDDLPMDGHRRSQFVSGYLWDLQHLDPGGLDWDARTVMKAIDYLGRGAGYKDLVKALLAADLELSGGAHACGIYDGAVGRGMGELLQDVSCADYVR
jgi:hypothetical protein